MSTGIFSDRMVQHPALGESQWRFMEEILADVPADIDYLVVTTAAPIAHYSKNAIAQQRVLGYPAQTTFDVGFFRGGVFITGRGNVRDELIPRKGYPIKGVRRSFMEVRDQWQHHWVRKEQADLIEAASRARYSNRGGGSPRGLTLEFREQWNAKPG